MITTESPPVLTTELPHFGNVIEWWFFHGSFHGSRLGCRHFMASIFRYELNGTDIPPSDGYYLILSTLDPSTGSTAVTSRGEQGVVDCLFRIEDRKRPVNLDPRLVEVYLEELRSSGPPAPVTLEHNRATLNTEPFSIAWKDFIISQSGGDFQITFQEPGTGHSARFTLRPESSRRFMNGIGASFGKPMAYVTIPRLGLAGTFGDEEVGGSAWFDHQWGNTSWFLSQPASGKVHGWDWVGINGDDGSDWIILISRDMESGNVIGRFAVVFEEGKDPQEFSEFTAEPLRHWESGKTHIRYPLGWRFVFPEISAEIAINALFDDQEIPVLGFMRAVWEGAAIATGSIKKRPFSGRARLELQGYGYITDFQQYLQPLVGRIEQCMESFFPRSMDTTKFREFTGNSPDSYEMTAYNDTIARPVWDLMSRKKKYWRPLFGSLMLEALGVPSEKYRMLISIVPELTHTGTLIIDDIEDGAKNRRGDVCIHQRYGPAVAINAANTLYFLPSVLYGEYTDLTDRQRLDFYKITLDTFIRGHFGQAQDIFWAQDLSPDTITAWSRDRLCEKILMSYDFKTASPAIAAAEAACILAGPDPEIRDACVRFARSFGVSFQIVNDLASFDGTEHNPGKSVDDLAAGKLTYILVKSLELLDEGDRQRLIQIICSPRLRRSQKTHTEGIELVCRSGALNVCRREAEAMVNDGWRTFSGKIPASEPKTMLRLFSRNLISPPNKTG